MASLFGPFPSSIRASRFGTFPTVNIGTTYDSIEIVAFAPGVDPTALDVSIDRGLLTISGERKTAQPDTTDDMRTYALERFTGTFRRIIELPQTADPDRVHAHYENGCLSITVGKRESSKPRAITIQ
ncbi:Hsp20/alpha crystallin family protein [Paraburkholderia madseniana]|uniref:Hsp20/alpha crystallin family protein n=1 Tax=Paraburkholderia madseniana TaxID=2599607 RepID=UPI001F2CE7D3|nr:Hsp20/alpha crystallin family protein [Paraburkholderia madseniana]